MLVALSVFREGSAMSTLESEIQSLIEFLKPALSSSLGETAFDVLAEDRAVTIATDDWSLRIETEPAPVVWLAIDDEPESAAEYDATIERVLTPAGLAALATANSQTDGALSALLTVSGDPFSAWLATWLAQQTADNERMGNG